MLASEKFLDLDIYNLQAIEILEHVGILEPTETQIITIESLLKQEKAKLIAIMERLLNNQIKI
jgi:hypothetical protein